MEKRALLAVVLSLIVLVLYQQWLGWQYGTPESPAPPVPEAKKPVVPEPARPAAPPKAAAAERPVPQEARELTVETDRYMAVFTSRGARLKSFQFKDYRSSAHEKSPPFDIVSPSPALPLPLGVTWIGAPAGGDADVNYEVEGSSVRLSGEQQAALTFRGRAGDGTTITKTLVFTGGSYPIRLEVSAVNPAGAAVPLQVLLTAPADQAVRNPDAPFEGLVALVDNKIKREHVADPLKEEKAFSGDVAWAGFGYTYFFIALLPESGGKHSVTLGQSGPALVLSVAPQPARDAARYTLFIGPKDLSVLEAIGKGLERSIDFGYFAFISIPLLYVLHFFHRFTASYGIDIILLTVLIKILTAPLTHKSYVSMKQMQRLQPQMERLKEKFKDDREKLNKEIMELYRRNGVNPLGGCLPMLLQFPVFIGLYNALSTPIELRHAPFLWIKDLSRPDWESLPFTVGGWHLGVPVLTILMGASMFIQQWMTPSAGDPNQRKMMLMMPLMFTFMFVTFPAGLTIYWLVNNILSIGQQWWINRMDK
ncbi:MAG TPA: membrane protein insertase YidC [candidate division Zixibacteria bacterium]|nr:membrane protein insertase YidC [candidate division Zixibacteria bacterium]